MQFEALSFLRTFFGRQVLEINQDGEVVASFCRDDVFAILAVENLLSTILDKVSVAFYLDRHKNLGLDLWGGNVEDDAVKIGYRLVDGNRGSSGRQVNVSGMPRLSRGTLSACLP